MEVNFLLFVSVLTAGQEWYTDDLNEAKLEYFYCVLVAILLLDILYVYLVTRKYERADWDSLRTKVIMNYTNDDDEVVDEDVDGGGEEMGESQTGDEHVTETHDGMSER